MRVEGAMIPEARGRRDRGVVVGGGGAKVAPLGVVQLRVARGRGRQVRRWTPRRCLVV